MVATPSLMSCFMNPGRADQISSIRSQNMLGDRRPAAAYDKSSPASGACLCLVKTLKDLSLCLYCLLYAGMTCCHFRLAGDPLSIMIHWFSSLLQLDFSFSQSLLLFYPHHHLERWWKDEQLQPARRQKQKKTKRKRGMGRQPYFNWLLNCWCFIPEEKICFCLFNSSSLWHIYVGYPSTWQRRIKHRLYETVHRKQCTQTLNIWGKELHSQQEAQMNQGGTSIPCSKKPLQNYSQHACIAKQVKVTVWVKLSSVTNNWETNSSLQREKLFLCPNSDFLLRKFCSNKTTKLYFHLFLLGTTFIMCSSVLAGFCAPWIVVLTGCDGWFARTVAKPMTFFLFQ